MIEPHFAIRPAREADEAFFVSVHHAAYRATVEKMFGWDQAVQDEIAARKFGEGGFFVIEKGVAPLGVFGWEDRCDGLWL